MRVLRERMNTQAGRTPAVELWKAFMLLAAIPVDSVTMSDFRRTRVSSIHPRQVRGICNGAYPRAVCRRSRVSLNRIAERKGDCCAR